MAMYSIKMMHQIRGGVPVLNREYKCLYSKILSRISPAGCSCIDDRLTKRNYSALTKCGTHHTLQMKQLQHTSCIVKDRRSVHYNIFINLVELMEGQFLLFHEMTGVPWWATILACTLPFRMALSYIIHKHHVRMKYKNNEIKMKLLPKCMKEEARNQAHLPKKDKQIILKELEIKHQGRLNKELGFNPYSGLIFSLLPVPYWIANSVALAHLSGANSLGFWNDGSKVHESMHHEGLFWFKDLCVADPYHILPVVIGITYIVSLELGHLSNVNYGKTQNLSPIEKKQETVKKVFTRMLTCWCVFSIYIFWDRPSAMVFYWVASGMFSLLFRLLLLHPYFERRIVSDDVHVLSNDDPYQTIYNNMKKRYRLLFLK